MASVVQLNEVDTAFANAVAKVVTGAGGFWRGAAEQLTEATEPHAIKHPHWPGNPRSVGRAVRRLAKHLLKAHSIQFTPPRPTDKTRVITFTLIKQTPETPETPSGAASATRDSTSGAGVSSEAKTPNAQNAQDARPDEGSADATPKDTHRSETHDTKEDASGHGVPGDGQQGQNMTSDGREEGDA
jgi:hypothetical protein